MGAYYCRLRVWNSYSILYTLMLLFFVDGGSARMWRFSADMEIAEVVHRRHLQTATYCVAIADADETQLQAALNWACGSGQGNVDCSSIQEGGSCYTPNTLAAHASYAFDSYYVDQKGASTACDFNGVATTTNTNPSNGTCVYPSTTSGSSTTPTTSTPTTSNSTVSPTSSSNTTFGSPTTSEGTTSNAMSSAITLPWMHALCGVISVMILSSKLSI